MTDVEKAKNTPPTVPAPMQVRSTKVVSMARVSRNLAGFYKLDWIDLDALQRHAQ